MNKKYCRKCNNRNNAFHGYRYYKPASCNRNVNYNPYIGMYLGEPTTDFSPNKNGTCKFWKPIPKKVGLLEQVGKVISKYYNNHSKRYKNRKEKNNEYKKIFKKIKN